MPAFNFSENSLFDIFGYFIVCCFYNNLCFLIFPSRSYLNCRVFAIVVNFPIVHLTHKQTEEIADACHISPSDDVRWYVMTTFSHTLCHTLNSKPW